MRAHPADYLLGDGNEAGSLGSLGGVGRSRRKEEGTAGEVGAGSVAGGFWMGHWNKAADF